MDPNISNDVLFELMSAMDLNQISSLCSSSSQMNQLCSSDRFNKLIVQKVSDLPYAPFTSDGFGQLRTDALRDQAFANRTNLVNSWLDKVFTIRPTEQGLETHLNVYLKDFFGYILAPGDYHVDFEIIHEGVSLTFRWNTYMTQVTLDFKGYYRKDGMSVVEPLPISLSVANVIEYYFGDQLTTDDNNTWVPKECADEEDDDDDEENEEEDEDDDNDDDRKIRLKHPLYMEDRNKIVTIDRKYSAGDLYVTFADDPPTNDEIDESVMVHLTFHLVDNSDYDVLIYNHPTGVRLVEVVCY